MTKLSMSMFASKADYEKAVAASRSPAPRERKKQIWLRPDQVDLLVECLKLVKVELDESPLSSKAHKMAGRFTYRRINELLAMLEPKP